MASLAAPFRSSSFWPSPPTSAVPSSRCSVDVYSSPRRRASSWARSINRLARGSSASEPPSMRARLARIAASSPRNAGRSTPSRRSVSAGTPSSGSTSADRMCSASKTGLCSRSASCWPATMAASAFSVKRSSCMSVSVTAGSRPRIGLVDELEEGLRGGLRLRREVGREHDPDTHVQVAGAVALEPGHALALEAEGPPVLGAGRDLEENAALQRSDGNLAPEQRFLQGDRHVSLEVVALARERAVRLEPCDHDEVRAARTLAGQADAAAAVHAAGDRDLEASPVDVDDPAGAMEGLLERDLGGDLDGCEAALRGWTARPGRPAPRRTRAAAAGPGHAQSRQQVVDRLTPAGREHLGLTGRRRLVAEHHVEEVRERARVAGRAELVADAPRPRPARVAEGEARKRSAGPERVSPAGRPARRRAGASVGFPVAPALVVLGALARVRQDRVRLVDLLEPLLGTLVAGVLVRMALAGKLAKGLLDLGLGRGPRHAEGPVVVLELRLVRHWHPRPRLDHHGGLIRRECRASDRRLGRGLAVAAGVPGRRLGRRRQRLGPPPEGCLEDLVHGLGRDDLDPLANLVGDVPEVL